MPIIQCLKPVSIYFLANYTHKKKVATSCIFSAKFVAFFSYVCMYIYDLSYDNALERGQELCVDSLRIKGGIFRGTIVFHFKDLRNNNSNYSIKRNLI